jgi:UDP:flavonoid glycosyltransferase YjiC (YdhE family)
MLQPMRELRVLVAAFGDAGHAFPAIALARALRGRGHQVAVETWEQWRQPVEESGLTFHAAEQYKIFPPPPPGSDPGAADAARALAPVFEELRPDVVVSDVLTVAPALAAELHGCRRATLVPHLYPVHEAGMPFFSFGAMPPRTPLGRAAWRAGLPVLEGGLRRGRRELNEMRVQLGLASVDRLHGGISEELVLVATYPELEYPRRWPAAVEVCGPLTYETPHPDIDLPEGAEPLVLIASSTAHDPDCRLIRRSLEALAGEPVRVVATTNGHSPERPIEVPPNAVLVGWLSYTQVMAAADLVVCHGGHGTICRSLEVGKPLLVSPAIGDMAENGARVQWAGCGLMLPRRLRRPHALRWVTRELLGNPAYAERARAIGTSTPRRTAEEQACRAIERLAG